MLILLLAHLIVSILMLLKDKFPPPNPVGTVAAYLEKSPVDQLPGEAIPWAISVFVCLILFLLVLFVVQ